MLGSGRKNNAKNKSAKHDYFSFTTVGAASNVVSKSERERERAKPRVELLVGARDERTPCLAPLVVEHGFGGSLEHGSEGSGGYMVTYAT